MYVFVYSASLFHNHYFSLFLFYAFTVSNEIITEFICNLPPIIGFLILQRSRLGQP